MDEKKTYESYLSYKGYAIYKSSLTLREQIFIRDELTMKPFVQYANVKEESFPIYLESEKKLYNDPPDFAEESDQSFVTSFNYSF